MTFAILGNLHKQGLKKEVLTLIGLLRKSGKEFCLQEEIADLCGRGAHLPSASEEECVARADMVVALGGDGTILSVARLVGTRQIPVLGINLGKLGFLAEVSPGDMEEALGEILAGHYTIEERLVLEASHPGARDHTRYAVNDFVIARSRSLRIIDIATSVNGAYVVTYRGDGLIVSTPTGSTAYALSTGGPIVIPTANVIGITPISPHTLSGRPLIVPDSSVIRVQVDSHQQDILFSADGQTEEDLTTPADFEIRKAKHSFRLVRRKGRSYFDVLRAKLFWGQDARA
jgi:NAD+ kinase